MNNYYQISAYFVFVMSKPKNFCNVLGILYKDDIIEVIKFTEDWAYFKYENKDAYVKKSCLKVIIDEPIKNMLILPKPNPLIILLLLKT